MEIGVFIPIGNNGWLISDQFAAIQADLRAQQGRSCCKAEALRLRLRTFDDQAARLRRQDASSGTTTSRAFTLMAGLAAVTSRASSSIASVAVLTMPPAIVARMASTIDSISSGRFGVNIDHRLGSGRNTSQMGLWPGDELLQQAVRLSAPNTSTILQRAAGTTGHARTSRASTSRWRTARMQPKPARPM